MILLAPLPPLPPPVDGAARFGVPVPPPLDARDADAAAPVLAALGAAVLLSVFAADDLSAGFDAGLPAPPVEAGFALPLPEPAAFLLGPFLDLPPAAAFLSAALAGAGSVADADAAPDDAADDVLLGVPLVWSGFEADAALLSLSAPVLDGASLRFS